MRKRVGLGLVLFSCLAVAVLLFWGGSSAQNGQDMQICEGCHEGVFQRLDKMEGGMAMLKHPRAPSQPLVCESCHGSTTEHAESEGQSFEGLIRFKKGTTTPVAKRNEQCLGCHEKRARMFWQGSSHEIRNVACADCHNPHKYGPESTGRFLLAGDSIVDTCNQCHKQPVASTMRFSHHPIREGEMSCTSCHQPHGTTSERLLKTNMGLNELCWTCHPKYRGPHINEHPPVRDNCANCHQAHGTNYPRLLKLPQIRMCRNCHVDFHGLSLDADQRRRLPHVLGRLCTDCHVNIHGSNHGSGIGEYFLR